MLIGQRGNDADILTRSSHWYLTFPRHPQYKIRVQNFDKNEEFDHNLRVNDATRRTAVYAPETGINEQEAEQQRSHTRCRSMPYAMSLDATRFELAQTVNVKDLRIDTYRQASIETRGLRVSRARRITAIAPGACISIDILAGEESIPCTE